jgi:pimeloyl-ACP methyl ester carboxylesterase
MACSHAAPDETSTVPQTSDHHISVPGGRMFAREWTPPAAADDTPLVLIHDSLGSVELWRDFPARLAAGTGRRVIAYDRLGFGRSDPRADRLTTRFVSEEAEIYLPRLLQYFQIDRFVPFGHSVGGGMAVHCGTALADSCAAIVTESAQMFAEDRTLRGIAAAKVDFRDPANFERLRRYHGDNARWVLEAWTETWLSPAFAAWTLAAELPKIACPMLAIHGDQDEYGSLSHIDLIRTLAGERATTKVLQGFGHIPHREQPEVIVGFVAEFLRG